MNKGGTYADSGVDVDAGARAVKMMAADICRTRLFSRVIEREDSFAGLVNLGHGLALLASVDGVGTKLQVAKRAGRYRTVGWDIAGHSINDLLSMGPFTPIGFLDYVASPKLDPVQMAEIVGGLCDALCEYKCPLLGGETAEMPGTYCPGEFDLVGTMLGTISIRRLLDPANVVPGDHLIGLASGGIGTNGYTKVREAIFKMARMRINTVLWHDDQGNKVTVADVLLLRHRCYYEPVYPVMRRGLVKSAAHITGGGLPGNLVRALSPKTHAHLFSEIWHDESYPPIFTLLKEITEQPERDRFKTFNDNVGFVLTVAPENIEKVLAMLRKAGQHAWDIGEVYRGSRRKPRVTIHTPEGSLAY